MIYENFHTEKKCHLSFAKLMLYCWVVTDSILLITVLVLVLSMAVTKNVSAITTTNLAVTTANKRPS